MDMCLERFILNIIELHRILEYRTDMIPVQKSKLVLHRQFASRIILHTLFTGIHYNT